MSLVDPARPEPAVAGPAKATPHTIVISLIAHVVVIALLVVVPLFGRVLLPSASSSAPMDAFVRAAAVPVVPPPAGTATATRAALPTPAATVTATTAPAPVPLEAPTGVSNSDAPAYVPGVAGMDGVALPGLGGVDGGMPGPRLDVPVPTPPPAPRTLRVGGDIRAPRKQRHVAPIYPAIAAQARVSGTVILEATIAPTGDVVDVRVLRSVPLLDAAAVEAARQWRYEPPRLNGTPIAVLLTVTVRFDQ